MKVTNIGLEFPVSIRLPVLAGRKPVVCFDSFDSESVSIRLPVLAGRKLSFLPSANHVRKFQSASRF